MSLIRALYQFARHARSPLAVSASVGVAWAWLERVHTMQFVIELAHSPQAAASWQFAQSRTMQTLLLAAILVACIACFLKLREVSALARPKRRTKRNGAKRK
jgi:hypothetical protein